MTTNRAPFTDVCVLITERKDVSRTKHYTTEDERTEIFCSVIDGVSRAEFYESAKAGIQLSATFEIYEDEYSGQKLLEHGTSRYKVQRCYPSGHGTLFLYCQEVIR